MRTVAIILGDNDFGSTFRNLLETLKRVVVYRAEAPATDDVRYMILQMALAHYLAFIREYFLKNLRILFDEEAEQDIAEGDHDGGAWYLELQSGTIKSY